MPKRDAFKLSSEDEQEDVEEQASDEQGSEQQNDSDDSIDRHTPSQYRKQRVERDDAEESQDEQSSQEEDDFEDELELQSTSNLSATPGAANQDMTSQFAELSRMFAAVCEQNRKLQLATSQMARRTARQSLDFDSPVRKSRIQVMATPDDSDVERDSLRSQSSRSTRLRLQEKFEVIAEMATDDPDSDRVKEWIRKHALQVMAQAGTTDDLNPKDAAFGGFKRASVCVFPLLSLSLR